MHYDDDDLLAFAHGLEDAPAGVEEHLTACLDCGARLRSLRHITDGLVRQTPGVEFFQRYEAAQERELATAHVHLRMGTVDQAPPTLGLVRALLLEAQAHLGSDLAVARSRSEQAISVALSIPEGAYPLAAIVLARGDAHREHANALRLLGHFPGALGALDRAAADCESLYASACPLAQVEFSRALVLFKMSRFAAATAALHACSDTFLEFGDVAGSTKARFMQASIYFEEGSITKAGAVFESLLDPVRRAVDREMLARLESNLGACAIALDDEPSARAHFGNALGLFEELHLDTEKVRIRWNLARLTLRRDPGASLRPLQEVRISFQTLGLGMDAALVALDMVEALLATGDTERAERLSAELLTAFQRMDANLNVTQALTYFHESTKARRATTRLTRSLRAYLGTPASRRSNLPPKHPSERFSRVSR